MEFTKYLRITNREDPDLGLHCLCRTFWQELAFKNLEIYSNHGYSEITKKNLQTAKKHAKLPTTSPWVPFRAKFRPLGQLFRPSHPLA